MQHRSRSKSRDGHSSAHDTREGSGQKRIHGATINGTSPIRVNFVGQKKGEKLTKIWPYQKFLNLSREIKYKKLDMRPIPVFSDYLVKLVIPTSRAI